VKKAQVQVLKDLINCYYIAFNILKDKLYITFTLIFLNFEAPFLLYINSSKEFGYSYIIYQVNANRKKRLILYLFKALILAKKNY
jgi:hypothetical protein